MANQDLGFNVFALDKASKTFIRLGERIEKLSDKLDELDRKKATPEIDVDVDKARAAAAAAAAAIDDEGKRRSGGFFRNMFTPNRQIVMSLRTGIPAALGSPIGAAALALGGVFAASFAGAVISSGMFAVIGAGFAGLAAVALKENARLQQSFAALGDTASSQLTQAAASLIPAFDQALRTVQGMFTEHIRAPLTDIFAGIGPVIVPAVESAMRTIGTILDSLASPQVVQGVQTVFAAISREMPRLGDSIGDAFVTIADNADDTAEAFGTVVTVLDAVVDASASAVVALTDLFNEFERTAQPIADLGNVSTEVWNKAGGDARGFMDVLGGAADAVKNAVGIGMVQDFLAWATSSDDAAKATGRAAERTEELANGLPTATERIDAMANAEENLNTQLEQANEALEAEQSRLEELKGSLFTSAEGVLGLREAQVAYQEQLDTTRETLEENGRTLDINTEKGQENRRSIDDMAAAALAQIEAMVEQGASTERVAKFTRHARDDFIDAAVAAGMEKEEARKLARQLGLVPSEVKTKLEAIDNASKEIQRLKERIAAIERQINVTVTMRTVFSGVPAGRAGGPAQVLHSGGIIGEPRRAHSGLRLRPGEHHVIGLKGERILSRPETAALDVLTSKIGRPGDGASAGGPIGGNERSMARAVARAINGATLIIDDRGRGRLVAREADLYGRAG